MGPGVETILVSENIILRGIQKKTQFHYLLDQDRSGSGQIFTGNQLLKLEWSGPF